MALNPKLLDHLEDLIKGLSKDILCKSPHFRKKKNPRPAGGTLQHQTEAGNGVHRLLLVTTLSLVYGAETCLHRCV